MGNNPHAAGYLIGNQPGTACEDEIQARETEPMPAKHIRIVQHGSQLVLVWKYVPEALVEIARGSAML